MKHNLKVIIALVITVCIILFTVGCVEKPTGDTMVTKGENTLLKVIREEKLLVGIPADYAPWSSLNSEGSFEGYDVDIAKLLGEALGVSVELIAVDTPSRVPALVSGKVDVLIAGLTPTNERAKAIAFSIPYASEGLVLVVHENRNINSYVDMAGKTIAVTRGTVQDLYATANFTDFEILRFDTNTNTYMAFKSGKTDGYANSNTSGTYSEFRNSPEKYKIVGEPFAKGLLSMGVKQGDQEWLNYLNNFITNIRFDGTNAALWKKWFGADPPSLVLE